MNSYVTFVWDEAQSAEEYAVSSHYSSTDDSYHNINPPKSVPLSGGGFGIWGIAIVLVIVLIWILRKDNKKQKSLSKKGEKGLSQKQRLFDNPTKNYSEASVNTRTTSFYVEDDGTIVRGQKSDSGFEQKSTIQSPLEQQNALSLIKESAEAGYAEAQYFLGISYEQGTVVPKNLETAKYWYELASAQGFPQAKYRLGRLLMSKEIQ